MAKKQSALRLPTGMTYEEACPYADPALSGSEVIYQNRLHTVVRAERATGLMGDWVSFTLEDQDGEPHGNIHHSDVNRAPITRAPITASPPPSGVRKRAKPAPAPVAVGQETTEITFTMNATVD
jgi:hypothetical protein